MIDWRNETDGLIIKGQIKLPYSWTVGETGSRFLVALRDKAKILGNQCPLCGLVYVPPRKNCGTCFVDIPADSWVEVGKQGVVIAYTIVHDNHALQPTSTPFAYALIRLEGADVSLLHIIKNNLENLQNGARVQARFAHETKGSILDIECFDILPVTT